mmetsp:Transcript_6526/g.25242  ORF Transcript_6526/g.25242 Transcript_6526/m.25242 type:complete len:753 (-) Transcript_6526:1009-3267(-)
MSGAPDNLADMVSSTALELAADALEVLVSETRAFQTVCDAIGLAADAAKGLHEQLEAMEQLGAELRRADGASLELAKAVIADIQSAWATQHSLYLQHIAHLITEKHSAVERAKALEAMKASNQSNSFLSPMSARGKMFEATTSPRNSITKSETSFLREAVLDSFATSESDLTPDSSYENSEKKVIVAPMEDGRPPPVKLASPGDSGEDEDGTIGIDSPKRFAPSFSNRPTIERLPEAIHFYAEVRENGAICTCIEAFKLSLPFTIVSPKPDDLSLAWLSPVSAAGTPIYFRGDQGGRRRESYDEDVKTLIQVCWAIFQYFRKDLRQRPDKRGTHPFDCITLSGFRKLLKEIDLIGGTDASEDHRWASTRSRSPETPQTFTQSMKSRLGFSEGDRGKSSREVRGRAEHDELFRTPQRGGEASKEGSLSPDGRIGVGEVDLIYCMQSNGAESAQKGRPSSVALSRGDGLSTPARPESVNIKRSSSRSNSSGARDMDFVSFLDAFANVAAKVCGLSLGVDPESKARAFFATVRRKVLPFLEHTLSAEVEARKRKSGIAIDILMDPRIQQLLERNNAILEALFRCYTLDEAMLHRAGETRPQTATRCIQFGSLVSLCRDFGLCPIYLSMQGIGELYEAVYYELLSEMEIEHGIIDEGHFPHGLDMRAFKQFISRAALLISPRLSMDVPENAGERGRSHWKTTSSRDTTLEQNRDQGYLGIRRAFLVMNASSGRNFLLSRDTIVINADVLRKGFQVL